MLSLGLFLLSFFVSVSLVWFRQLTRLAMAVTRAGPREADTAGPGPDAPLDPQALRQGGAGRPPGEVVALN